MCYARTHIYNLFSVLKIICTYSNGLWYLISKQNGKIRIIHIWQADLWCKKLWTFWWMSISVIFYDGIKSSHSVRIIFLSYNLGQKCSPDTSQHQTPPTNSFKQWNRSICLIWSINLRTVRSSPSLFPFICEFVFVLRRFERAATFCSFIWLKLPQQRWRVLWLLLSIFVLICLHACICSLKCLSNNWKIYDKTWWAWWFFATTTTTAAADAVISLLSLLSCQYVIVSLFSSGSCHSFLFVRLLWFESGENVWVFFPIFLSSFFHF